jgi:glycosyltransferase involved in cell wall biosynthesis
VVLPFYRERPFALPSPRVARWIQDFRPDVVHAAQPMLLASSGAVAAHRQDLPLVASFHTHLPRYLDLYPAWRWSRSLIWWRIRRRHALADVNLATSADAAADLAAHGVRDLHVLQRGVDTEARHPRFADPGMRARMLGGNPDDRTLLVYVGRLAAEKQIQLLAPLLRGRDDVALAVVGDGPYRAELERAFAGTATTFLGFLRGEELASAFASADAFAFPSLTETLGLVILEAMASGLPVLAARSGPTEDQVEDGRTGLLFTDSASLGDAVDRLHRPGAREQMAAAARNEAERFSWDAASDDLLRYYELAIARHAAPTPPTPPRR